MALYLGACAAGPIVADRAAETPPAPTANAPTQAPPSAAAPRDLLDYPCLGTCFRLCVQWHGGSGSDHDHDVLCYEPCKVAHHCWSQLPADACPTRYEELQACYARHPCRKPLQTEVLFEYEGVWCDERSLSASNGGRPVCITPVECRPTAPAEYPPAGLQRARLAP